MDPDDQVCLCFKVTLRKIRTYLRTEDPPVASLVSECLGAGTGCQWCVPFLKHLHAEHQAGRTPDLRVSPERYADARKGFHKSGERDEGVVREAGAGDD
ncbi:MAG: (2Fe-2S)-binding protein [Phycisphaerales bacterium]